MTKLGKSQHFIPKNLNSSNIHTISKAVKNLSSKPRIVTQFHTVPGKQLFVKIKRRNYHKNGRTRKKRITQEQKLNCFLDQAIKEADTNYKINSRAKSRYKHRGYIAMSKSDLKTMGLTHDSGFNFSKTPKNRPNSSNLGTRARYK